MNLETLRKDMVAAMKAKDKPRKEAISSLISAVKKAGIDAGCREDIPEEMVDQAILKEMKTAQEQVDTCPADRAELLEEYRFRYEVIKSYAPAQMEKEDIAIRISIHFAEVAATKNKGQIMKAVMGELKGKADGKLINQGGSRAVQIEELYKRCRLCPRRCQVNRLAGERGFCGMDARIFAARAALHFLGGAVYLRGNGFWSRIFFRLFSAVLLLSECLDFRRRGRSGNHNSASGRIFLKLQEQGAANINLVTPTHFAPSILAALKLARQEGLSIPAVYNCSGYESVEMLEMLAGWIDIYLTDFKYADRELAARYSRAADYPDRAADAVGEMVRQTGPAVFDGDGLIKKGVIVRHLLLPGHVKKFQGYCAVCIRNLEGQGLDQPHEPVHAHGGGAEKFPELNRRVTKREYNQLVDFALDLGVENGFIQEGAHGKGELHPGL